MSVKNHQHHFRRISRPALFEINCILFILTLLFHLPSKAQPLYGDEWINTKQTYLRIPIVQTGFYRISFQELETIGLPVEKIQPASLQIFRRGKELAIEVKDGAEGYINFYGQKNDGARDSSLYVYPGAMPHPYYSLYSDTSAYFLTWRLDGGTGKRIGSEVTAPATDSIRYHFEEASELFNSHYATGNFYPAGTSFNTGTALTAYDTGEGWTGRELHNEWQTIDINTADLVSDYFEQTEVKLVIVGRNAGIHEAEIWTGRPQAAGRKINTLLVKDYNSFTYTFSFGKDDIAKSLSNGKITFSIYSKGSISVSCVQWHYPQKTSLPSSITQKTFYLKTDTQPRQWKTGNTAGWKFYNCTDAYHLTALPQIGQAVFPGNATAVIGVQKLLKIPLPRIVHFKPLDSLETDYLIVSHPLVRLPVNGVDPVAAYAAYRATPEGGAYKPFIIHSEEIADRFHAGEPGPAGISRMISRFYKNGRLKFVFIIGRSADPQTARKRMDARNLDMIPNAGWPGSDLALSMGIGGADPFVPLVPVGRINAAGSEEVLFYLEKVKAMEAQPSSAEWRKNILHLSGGRTHTERQNFRNFVDSFKSKISGTSLAGKVHTISKKTDDEIEQFPIHIPVNRGAALITLYGHSGLDMTDIDIGLASDADRQYRNHPFYPAVIANGCAVGSIFYSTKTISTDWIFSQKNGAVLFLAHTFNGISTSLRHYTDAFYDVLADSEFVSQPFGIIQKEAIRRNMLDNPSLSNGMTVQQMNLHGDPAIRIFPAVLPDYSVDSTLFSVSDTYGKKLTSWSDSVMIRIGIVNSGRFKKGTYQLSVTAGNQSQTLLSHQAVYPAAAIRDTLTIRMAKPFLKAEKLSWQINIDPENTVPEENETNNLLHAELTIPEAGAFPLLPVPDYVTDKRETELVAQIPFDRTTDRVVFEWDTTSSFTSLQKRIVQPRSFIATLKINIPEKSSKIYWRVYMPEDSSRPVKSRSFSYLPDGHASQLLPEGIAMISQTYPFNIQEGAAFNTEVTFRNVGNAAFSDSLIVQIKHRNPEDTETLTLKIPPLGSGEAYTLHTDFSTRNKPGNHQISFLFNATHIEESIYTNNEVRFIFSVFPDLIAPVLNVTIDGRQLTNGESVTSQPQIGILLSDENKSLIRTDTTDIQVWLKEICPGCKEQRLFFKGYETQILPSNNFKALLKPTVPLKSGTYLLKVKAADVSGNRAPDYQIHFKITDAAKILRAGVSPNPASHWFRFYLDLEGVVSDDRVVIHIYDVKGNAVSKISKPLHTGKNEWFWQPENLVSGVYFYQMKFKEAVFPANTGETYGLNGKLIWVK
jgi:hypothetical protein